MKRVVASLILVVLATSAYAASLPAFSEKFQWEAWKSFHKKSYNDEYEETFRRAIWVYNLKKIEENRKSQATFNLGLNNLADLTLTEYRHLMLGERFWGRRKMHSGSRFSSPGNVRLPKHVDWRTKGCVTTVKNQGQLGHTWAFSALDSLAGQYCINTKGKLIDLSVEKLVDCCSSCNSVDDAFRYMIAHNRLDEADENCNFSAAAYGASLTGYVDIPRGSEKRLQIATAYVGPISVAIDASHASFQLYHSGVYDEPECSSTQLDHVVLVVGYGTLQGDDYWLVKNSWGVNWGMDGYIMMSRNKGNQCGIATEASYPTGVTAFAVPDVGHQRHALH